MRLDEYIFKNNLAKSRSKAKEMIINGYISVNDIISRKPSYDVKLFDKIKIIDNPYQEFVSRGGLKLKKALELFNIDLTNKVVLDIGSSTGGFTDCCLKHNAKMVYALDVGTNQLDASLLNNKQVVSLENLNFKDSSIKNYPLTNFIVSDVSFISIKQILLKIKKEFSNIDMVILYKPQFETENKYLNKNGVVSQKKFHYYLINSFIKFLYDENYKVLDFTYSPLLGHHQGNIEYLFYLSLNNQVSNKNLSIDFYKIIDEAFNYFKGMK